MIDYGRRLRLAARLLGFSTDNESVPPTLKTRSSNTSKAKSTLTLSFESMCLIIHEVTKYTCGHIVRNSNLDHCDEYITYGECDNVVNQYPASSTKRTKCADCLSKDEANKQPAAGGSQTTT
jgi:hypothetical protein